MTLLRINALLFILFTVGGCVGLTTGVTIETANDGTRFPRDVARSSLSRVATVLNAKAGTPVATAFRTTSSGKVLLTSAHAVGTSGVTWIKLYEGGDALPAEILGREETIDLALLKLPCEVVGPAPFDPADFSSIEPGIPVVAITATEGYPWSVAVGAISHIDRLLPERPGTRFSQCDLRVGQGSSGGVVLDEHGKLVGMISRGSAAGTATFLLSSRDIETYLTRNHDLVTLGQCAAAVRTKG